MKTTSITRDEFDSIKIKHTQYNRRMSAENRKILSLAVDEGVRFQDHPHKKSSGAAGSCRFGARLYMFALSRKIRIATKHDGRDFLILRKA